jgi:hypothetical protein
MYVPTRDLKNFPRTPRGERVDRDHFNLDHSITLLEL